MQEYFDADGDAPHSTYYDKAGGRALKPAALQKENGVTAAVVPEGCDLSHDPLARAARERGVPAVPPSYLLDHLTSGRPPSLQEAHCALQQRAAGPATR